MGAIFVSWAISGTVLLGLAVALGLAANSRIDGILIDQRGRYSLTHFQLCLWSITVLSLLAGVFFGRLVHGVADPMNIVIPQPVLGLLGIVSGAVVTSTGIKRSKDITRPDNVAASGGLAFSPRLMQMFLVEEGAFADEAVDITKFQNFVITVLLVIGYITIAVKAISDAGTAQRIAALPNFNASAVLILLGISQAAWVVGKIPNSAGQPDLTVGERNDARDAFHVQKRAAGQLRAGNTRAAGTSRQVSDAKVDPGAERPGDQAGPASQGDTKVPDRPLLPAAGRRALRLGG